MERGEAGQVEGMEVERVKEGVRPTKKKGPKLHMRSHPRRKLTTGNQERRISSNLLNSQTASAIF